MRELGAWTRKELRGHLPRVGRGELLGLLGVGDLQPEPVLPAELVQATLAATALDDFRGNAPEEVAARVAALHACEAPAAQVAAIIGISSRSAQGLRRREPDASLVRAIRLQAALRRQQPPVLVGEPEVTYSVGPTETNDTSTPLP